MVALAFVKLAKSNQVTNVLTAFKIVILVLQVLLAINVSHHIFLMLIILLVNVPKTQQSKFLHVFVILDIFNIMAIVLYVILLVVHYVKFLMFVSVVLRILFLITQQVNVIVHLLLLLKVIIVFVDLKPLIIMDLVLLVVSLFVHYASKIWSALTVLLPSFELVGVSLVDAKQHLFKVETLAYALQVRFLTLQEMHV